MLALLPAVPAAAQPVRFRAADGRPVFGDLREAQGSPRGTILLFHMAGSNLGEYAPIAPVLNELGFDTLAIDQRSGGPMWGRTNRTVGRTPMLYWAAAAPDLDGALSFARKHLPGPVLAWGSSYTAALVFDLAARHPADVAGVLAFSPDEYVSGVSVHGAAAMLRVPVFITMASDPREVAAARKVAAAVRGGRVSLHLPNQGLHGSQTLRADRNPVGWTRVWLAVRSFLRQAAPASRLR